MHQLNRRKALFLGLTAGAAALNPFRAFSSVAEQPDAADSPSVDPRSLIPTELLQPLDQALAKYGDQDVGASNLASLRKMDVEETPHIKSRNVERRMIPGPSGGPDVAVYVI